MWDTRTTLNGLSWGVMRIALTPFLTTERGSSVGSVFRCSTCGGAWPNVLSGASDTRRDPTDTGKASGSERMRGHTRRGCSQRPRVRPSSGYGAAQAATCARQRRCAPAPPPPHRTAVAVAYNSAHRHGRHNPHPSPSEAYPYPKL